MIDCLALREKEIKLDTEGRVWPCCFYSAAANRKGCTGDDYIDNLPSDWNDINKHKLTDILNSKPFTEHWNTNNWNTNPPPLCVENCSKSMRVEKMNQ